MTQASISCRLRFSVVTLVEYTLTAIFLLRQQKQRQTEDYRFQFIRETIKGRGESSDGRAQPTALRNPDIRPIGLGRVFVLSPFDKWTTLHFPLNFNSLKDIDSKRHDERGKNTNKVTH